MKWWHWKELSLQARLVLATTAIVAISTVTVLLLSLEREQQNLKAALEQQAEFMLDAVEGVVADEAGESLPEALARTLDRLVDQNPVVLSLVMRDMMSPFLSEEKNPI